jgi:DNA-binding cell septation regulator SpoVG
MPNIPQNKTIECINWRPFGKNTLRGFATLQLASGLIIVDCTLHQKDNSRWVSMPGKPWTDPQGQTKYAQIVDFIDREPRERFSKAAVEAIDHFVAKQSEKPKPAQTGDRHDTGDKQDKNS